MLDIRMYITVVSKVIVQSFCTATMHNVEQLYFHLPIYTQNTDGKPQLSRMTKSLWIKDKGNEYTRSEIYSGTLML